MRITEQEVTVYKVRAGNRQRRFFRESSAVKWYCRTRAKQLRPCQCNIRAFEYDGHAECLERWERAEKRLLGLIKRAKYRRAVRTIVLFHGAMQGVSRERLDQLLALDVATWADMFPDEVISSCLDGMEAA